MFKTFRIKWVAILTVLAMVFVGYSTTYTKALSIENVTSLLKEVYPATTHTIESGGRLRVTAVAYVGSAVTAKLDGMTISLSPNLDTLTADRYALHEGYFNVRNVTKEEKSRIVGSVSFRAVYLGDTELKYSGNITVTYGAVSQPVAPSEPETPTNPDPDITQPEFPPVDPDEPSGQLPSDPTTGLPAQDKKPTFPNDIQNVTPNGDVAKQIRITNQYTEVVRYKSNDTYPNGVDYQLVKGMVDTIEAERGNYIDLKSGITMYKPFGGYEIFTDNAYTENYVQSAYTYSNIEGTTLSIRTGWDSPVKITPVYQPSIAGTVSSFTASTVEVKMPYVTAVPNIKGNFINSPLVAACRWEKYRESVTGVEGYKLILTLKKAGKYYGAHTYRDETGRLTIRFNHAPYGINTSKPLTGLDIIVDPGHGMGDPGAIAASGVGEKVYNLMAAELVTARLKEKGANVTMLPSNQVTLSLSSRVAYIYNNRPDMFIAMHHNSSTNKSASGFEVYYNGPMSSPLGSAINDRVKLIMPSRGSKYYNFQVTRSKQVPSVLVESSFISNPNDERLYANREHLAKLAQSIADGVVDYYRR